MIGVGGPVYEKTRSFQAAFMHFMDQLWGWVYFEEHFDGENAGEDVIKVIEDDVSVGILIDGVFCSQSDGWGADDNHNEELKVPQVDYEVSCPSNAAGGERMDKHGAYETPWNDSTFYGVVWLVWQM